MHTFTGPTLINSSQLDQLLLIGSHAGVIYFRLFKYIQQHTAGFTEQLAPHLQRPVLHLYVVSRCTNCRFLIVDSSLCMSFYYHMYGTSIGSLEVIAYSSAGTQVLFSQSSDQGNKWYYQEVHIANLDNVKVSFGSITHVYELIN